MAFLLIALLIAVPLAELYVIIKVGGLIGVLPTIGLLLADSIAGGILLRIQGRSAWRRFRATMEAGRIPAREVLDGALVIVGGALLLTPGFITDAAGLLCLLPPTRALIRGLVTRPITSHVYFRAARLGTAPLRGRAGRRDGRRGGPAATPDDVEGTAYEAHEDRAPRAQANGRAVVPPRLGDPHSRRADPGGGPAHP